jgi:molecular chaperone DnaK
LPLKERFEILSDFVPSLKRILDENALELLAGKKYSHVQLLSAFFNYLLSLVKDHCGNNMVFDEVVFSHPVEFESAKVKIIESALKENGFNSIKKQYEPIAAIAGYALEHLVSDNEGILVFDFGGGTIDVAFIQNKYGELKSVCEPKGDNSCGGQDLDNLLYADLRNKILSKYQYDVSQNGIMDIGILNSCRRLKEYFSGQNDVYDTNIVLVINSSIITYKYSLSREQFNNIIYKKVDEAVNVAKNVLSEVNQRGYKVDKILLIGGSSKLSLIPLLLKNVAPNSEIVTCGEKDIAVALGNVINFQSNKTSNNETKSLEKQCGFDEELNTDRQMICKKCGSERCYKLVQRRGYHCLDCGWEGVNVTVKCV